MCNEYMLAYPNRELKGLLRLMYERVIGMNLLLWRESLIIVKPYCYNLLEMMYFFLLFSLFYKVSGIKTGKNSLSNLTYSSISLIFLLNMSFGKSSSRLLCKYLLTIDGS